MISNSMWPVIRSLWNLDNMRIAPNPVLRGSLFGMVPRGSEEVLRDFKVYEDSRIVVTYDGAALGQADLDVWLRLIQIVGQRFVDRKTKSISIEIVPSVFLKEIGRTGGKCGRLGGNDREWLVKSLKRLAGVITVKTPNDRKGIIGSLVKGAAWNDEQDKIVVEIDNIVGYLFAAHYTMISTSARVQLLGDDMALWLHAFIGAHRSRSGGEFYYHVDTLRDKCRSKIADRHKFKYFVTQKMNKLMELPRGTRGFHSWEWEKRTILRVHFEEPLQQHSLLSRDSVDE